VTQALECGNLRDYVTWGSASGLIPGAWAGGSCGRCGFGMGTSVGMTGSEYGGGPSGCGALGPGMGTSVGLYGSCGYVMADYSVWLIATVFPLRRGTYRDG